MKSLLKRRPKKVGPAFALPSDTDASAKDSEIIDTGDTKERKKNVRLSVDPENSERLRIRKELREAARPSQGSIGQFGTGEQEDEKKIGWGELLKDYCAKADVFASAHTVPKHRICISTAAILIPFSLVVIVWDILAAEVFQIPHLSTINSPGFILFINFISMPIAMYGYMMEYLMHECSRMASVGLICVVCHPILFFVRAFMEYYYDGYRNQLKLYYEAEGPGQAYEYPIGSSDPSD